MAVRGHGSAHARQCVGSAVRGHGGSGRGGAELGGSAGGYSESEATYFFTLRSCSSTVFANAWLREFFEVATK